MSIDRKGYTPIPEAITETLDRKTTNAYRHHRDWNFNPSTLEPVVNELIAEAQKLFKPSQKWEPEAIRTPWGYVGDGSDRPDIYSVSVWISLQAKGFIPTKTRGHFWARQTLLDLGQIVDYKNQDITTRESEHKAASRRYLHFHGALNFGQFGTEDELDTAPTAYFIRRVSLEPFYLWGINGGRSAIVGEDPTRVMLEVDLLNGADMQDSRIRNKTPLQFLEVLRNRPDTLGYIREIN